MSSRVVVVTGASGGVGRAAARAFGERGDKVALLARGEVGLKAAAEDVRAAGGEALVLPVDVADHRALEEAGLRAEAALGPVDVWVNVAFSSLFAEFADIKPDEFKRATEVTYLGFVYGTRVALGLMKPRDRGTIVQTGSALAKRGIPLQSAYCGAKHAIQGFQESLRTELMHDGSGIRTTMVHLPGVNTPQFDWLESRMAKKAQPVPPIYQPEICGEALAYAADHPGRREYWIGGSTVGTILANRLIPGLLDRYLARTGFRSQQTGREHDPNQPANLWEPADGPSGRDYGAHGSFDHSAHVNCYQMYASRHRRAAVLGGAAVAAGVWLLGRKARRAL